MEAARQRMLAIRRQLDEYDKCEGTSAWDVSEHARLADELIVATDEYIRLVTDFLYENSFKKKRVSERHLAA